MYWDTLIRIKNAQDAGKKTVIVPYSKMDFSILESLVKHKFLKEIKIINNKKNKKSIEVTLGNRPINEVKFISKPSRHIYAGYRDIKPVKSGFGKLVVSTSLGIMTGEEAKKKKVGGEILFEIW